MNLNPIKHHGGIFDISTYNIQKIFLKYLLKLISPGFHHYIDNK